MSGTSQNEITVASNVFYSLSNNWPASSVGNTYKCQVKTNSSISSIYDSDWSASYGSVVFSASAVTSTLKLDPNGGTVNGSSNV